MASGATTTRGTTCLTGTGAAGGLEDVVEHEAGSHGAVHEVYLHALQIVDGHRVHVQSETLVILQNTVVGAALIGEGHTIGHATAAAAGDEHAYGLDGVIIHLVEEPAHLLHGWRRQFDLLV